MLAELVHGKKRFNQLKRSLGNINSKALSDEMRSVSFGWIAPVIRFIPRMLGKWYNVARKGVFLKNS
ncbi:winged helix-turn-helix transcriptional regulator [Paenibacillus macerans]|uniref:winged helix-turn-helix transcriptional regulator n=1 Tax=Paenibacillus macerans TaxID=44252 RepID=UPI002E1E7EBD|nr:winged helix-turn-helix transcriptional regulator [Paenibacillus macerans]